MEKKHYILNSTEVDIPYGSTKRKIPNISKKGRTFRHFMLFKQKIQVCKMLDTGILCISQKEIHMVHKNKTTINTLRESTQRKHQKQVTSQEDSFFKEHVCYLM